MASKIELACQPAGDGPATGAKFAEHKDAVRVAAEYNAAGNCGECYPALVTITPCD